MSVLAVRLEGGLVTLGQRARRGILVGGGHQGQDDMAIAPAGAAASWPEPSEAPQLLAAPREILERETGLEPATPSLGSSCSTN